LSQVVERIIEDWPTKASVTRWHPTFKTADGYDYPLSTLPVDQDELMSLPEKTKQSLSLSLWIQYNRRTIDAEEYIANPAIDWLLREGNLSEELNTALMQTAVDERFHTYFHTLALKDALSRNSVQSEFTRSVTVRELLGRLDQCNEQWQRRFVQLAYAAVAEVSVNAFLEILSTSKEIQKSNRELVHMHNLDEWSHSSVFIYVVEYLINTLAPHKSEFFITEIKYASQSFLKHDFSMYENVFRAHGIKLVLKRSNSMMTRDMSGIDRLVGRLGIT